MLTIGHLTGFASGAQGIALISNRTITNGTAAPTDAYAGYRLASNGQAQRKTGTGGSWTAYSGEWLVRGSASQFECRATLNSGTLNSGTTGSWLVLTSDRTWDVSQTGIGTQTANLTIEIRRVATGVVVTSATIDITADVA